MPGQPDGPVELEPVEPLDGTPAPPRRQQWIIPQGWQTRLPGLLALVEGLALLALFWLAPWFSWRVPVNIPLGIPTTPALENYFHFLAADHSYSGWAIAQGISVVNTAFVPLVPLWLIPLAALALLVLATLHLRHIIPNRWMSAALLVFSPLALLVQLSFFIQARTIQAPPSMRCC
jgi:hypothetical protein